LIQLTRSSGASRETRSHHVVSVVPKLEDHHNFPTKFEQDFLDAGIDPEQHKMYVEEYEHRRKPDGLHTGDDNWNALWKRYIRDHDNLTREDFLAQLSSMMKKVKWLKI
jgi:Predicted lipoprotein of unknown function (DUF2380)